MPGLKEKILNKTAVIAICGLGYVGLPLAVAFARSGFKVLGFDIQQEKVDLINQGESYIRDITEDQILPLLKDKLLEATTEQNRLSGADVICICVPTPLTKTKEPNLSYVIQTAEGLCSYIKPDQLIVLESTTYPGTTREVLLPILEKSRLKG